MLNMKSEESRNALVDPHANKAKSNLIMIQDNNFNSAKISMEMLENMNSSTNRYTISGSGNLAMIQQFNSQRQNRKTGFNRINLNKT